MEISGDNEAGWIRFKKIVKVPITKAFSLIPVFYWLIFTFHKRERYSKMVVFLKDAALEKNKNLPEYF